jgi:acetyl-CoA carboxylase biotin carboxyl carrier protein
MTFKELQELVKLINKSNLTEFKMKDGELELSIRTDKYQKQKQQTGLRPPAANAPQAAPIIQMPPVQQPYTPPAPQPAPAPQAAKPAAQEPAKEAPEADSSKQEEAKYLEIRSPIVGTFYRASSPEKPPHAKVGDNIEVGQVVCIVEAMKLFNEIESELAGKVVKVMVEDAQPVEYDQVLFLIDPEG